MDQTNTGVISLSIKDVGALSAAYMPFVMNGGVFVPTQRHYRLGDSVFIFLKLLDQSVRLPVLCRVVWMTPQGAQGNKVPGVGLQFCEVDAGATKAKIEEMLKDSSSTQQTNTM